MIDRLIKPQFRWRDHCRSLFASLFPSRCLLCEAPASLANLAICEPCYLELPYLGSACYQCAQALPAASLTQQACGNCLKQAPAFDRTIALFDYETPLPSLISHLKFAADLKAAKLLGELLAYKLQNFYKHHAKPDFIIPMPLHARRLQQRGFNQSLELARPSAKLLNIELQFRACKRTLATLAQTSLPLEKRHRNVNKAFAVTQNIQGRHIAIIDDVVTSTATVNSLSLTLRQAGAAQIDVWCIARTQLIK